MMLVQLQEQLARHSEAYRLACLQVKTERTALREAEASLLDAEEAQTLLQDVAQRIQQRVHRRVASVVSRCLKEVFGPDYDFRIDFVQARGKTEARLVLIHDGKDIEEPINSCGGGVVDITSFALRLARLTLARPRLRKLLVLDEPAKHLSPHYRPQFAQLLTALQRELDMQIIMVTHAKELTVGNVIELP